MKLHKVIMIFLLVLNLTAIGTVGYLANGIINLLTWQVIKTDFYGEYLNSQVKELIEIVEILTIKTDIYEKYLDYKVDELEENTKNKIDVLRETIEELHIKTDASTIKEANVLIVNRTIGAHGSGTHIKINGQSYILTCAHLTDYQDDELIAVLDNEEEYTLFLVKIDKDSDLALYKINLEIDLPYIEIADEFPEEGSEVIVIGNPNGFIDVITDGIIAKIEEENYYVTNKAYKGNSGGAILYEGKLIGILSQVGVLGYERFGTPPLLVNFGWSVSLQKIHTFLKNVK